MIVNTLCGAYAVYGLAGLHYEWRAILLYGVIMVLQSIIAIQLMIFCVYLTPNQVTSVPQPLMIFLRMSSAQGHANFNPWEMISRTNFVPGASSSAEPCHDKYTRLGICISVWICLGEQLCQF